MKKLLSSHHVSYCCPTKAQKVLVAWQWRHKKLLEQSDHFSSFIYVSVIFCQVTPRYTCRKINHFLVVCTSMEGLLDQIFHGQMNQEHLAKTKDEITVYFSVIQNGPPNLKNLIFFTCWYYRSKEDYFAWVGHHNFHRFKMNVPLGTL